MIFVDTGYLLAIAKPRDEFHLRALRWAETVGEPFLTTEYVVWETINTLSIPIDRPKAYVLLAEMSHTDRWDLIAASNHLFARGLALHQQHGDKEWSLTDCVSFVITRERGIHKALTHDHHFEQAGFERCSVMIRHNSDAAIKL